MTAVQPDLFGQYEAHEALLVAREGTHACPSCGTTERNWLLFENSHGYRVTVDGIQGIGGFPVRQHPIYGAMCTAQYLKRNHIIYAVNHRDAHNLIRDVERAAQLRMNFEEIIVTAAKRLDAREAL